MLATIASMLALSDCGLMSIAIKNAVLMINQYSITSVGGDDN